MSNNKSIDKDGVITNKEEYGKDLGNNSKPPKPASDVDDSILTKTDKR